MLLAVVVLLVYNSARFGHPLDFGYVNANVADKLRDPLRTYGQFNIHYAAKNFWVMWLSGPQWDPERNVWKPNLEGMSLLLTMPALIFLPRARRPSPLTIAAWSAFALLLIPLLLYYNTGWWQFGYRFSLDFIVPVIVLMAFAAGEGPTLSMRTLIFLGVLINFFGVVWWHRPY
jgi:hypothetical protein